MNRRKLNNDLINQVSFISDFFSSNTDSLFWRDGQADTYELGATLSLCFILWLQDNIYDKGIESEWSSRCLNNKCERLSMGDLN